MSWDKQKFTIHLQRLKGGFVNYWITSQVLCPWSTMPLTPRTIPVFCCVNMDFNLLGAIAWLGCLFGFGFFGWWACGFFKKNLKGILIIHSLFKSQIFVYRDLPLVCFTVDNLLNSLMCKNTAQKWSSKDLCTSSEFYRWYKIKYSEKCDLVVSLLHLLAWIDKALINIHTII